MYRVTIKRFVKENNSDTLKEVELLLFDDRRDDEDLQLVSPKLTLEDNDMGSFTFAIPPNHRYANHMAGRNSDKAICESKQDTIVIYKNGEWYWEGEVVDSKKNFYNQKTVTCDGALGYLKITTQPLKHYSSTVLEDCVFSFLSDIIEYHNESLEKIEETTGLSFKNRKVYVDHRSIIDVKPTDILSFDRTTNFENTLETINKRLVNKLGGHVRVRRESSDGDLILDYFSDDRLIPSDQRIEFGKNLLDFNKNIDISEIATVIIPRGDDVDNNSIFFKKESYYKGLSQKVDLSWTDIGGNGSPCGDRRICSRKDILEEYGYVEAIAEFSNIKVPILTKKEYPTFNQGGYIANDSWGWTTMDAYIEACKTRSLLSEEDGSFMITNKHGIKGSLSAYVTIGDNVKVRDRDLYRYSYLAALRILGQDHLNNRQFDKLELELSVLDMGRFGADNPESLDLYNTVVCSSKPHGMYAKTFPVYKLDIELDSVANCKVTLGSSDTKTISETTGVAVSTLNSDPMDDDSAYSYYKNVINKTRLESDALINGATKGYITILQKDDEDNRAYSDAILITSEKLPPSTIAKLQSAEITDYLEIFDNSEDPNVASGLDFWIWNAKGLAYYSTDGTNNKESLKRGEALKVAITSNGKIVADEINAKTINGYKINGAIITSSTLIAASGGYRITIENGKIIGSQDYDGATAFCSIYPASIVLDYSDTIDHDPGKDYKTRRGFKVVGEAILLESDRLCVKAPKWCEIKHEGKYQRYTHGWTGAFKVQTKGYVNNDDYITELQFVNGILIGGAGTNTRAHYDDHTYPDDKEYFIQT